MCNKIDKIMLGVLLALLVLSGGVHWREDTESLVELEIAAFEMFGEAKQKPVVEMPDFSNILDVKAKKSAFFGFLLPIVQKENDTILQHRDKIIGFSFQSDLSESSRTWLADIAKKYGIRDVSTFDEAFFQKLLARVDIIPASLTLAQSGNESAWGTSRFARQGNNFFGQWCFSPGCGIVPESRPDGETYEVQKFEDVTASVSAYMHNLNTNHRYRVLRELREQIRKSQKPVTGAELAHSLRAYSIRGDEYVKELLSIINSNKLLLYDLENL